MILPKDIITQHKIRDSKICTLYADGISMKKIGSTVGLSTSRVAMILYKNRECIKLETHWEKTKRISQLKRLLNAHPNKMKNKSTLDILAQLHKEIEGEKVEHSGSFTYTEMPAITMDGQPLEYNLGSRN